MLLTVNPVDMIQFHSAEVSAKFQGKEYTYQFEYRNVWEWVVSLVSDNSLSASSHWAPQREYFCEGGCCERIVNELYTADAWWDIQVSNNDFDLGWSTDQFLQVTAASSKSISSLLPALAYLVRQWSCHKAHQEKANHCASSMASQSYLQCFRERWWMPTGIYATGKETDYK